MSNIFSLLDFTTLTIKIFRIRLLNSDFLEGGIASNDDANVTNKDIMVSFTISNTAQFILTCLCTFRLHGMNGRTTSILLNTFNWRNPSPTLVNLFFQESCKQFPTLAVSISLGFHVMENQLALENSGFNLHS